MAGGRSQGCSTCKKRKIKCDERRPTCLFCERAGYQCEGLTTMFVYYPEMEVSHARPWQAAGRPRKKENNSKPEKPKKTVKIVSSQAVKAPVSTYSKYSQYSGSIISFPTSKDQKLAADLIKTLKITSGTGYTLEVMGSYIFEIPSRVGHSLALDTALECFMTAHRGLYNPSAFDKSLQIHQYGRALRVLRTELEKPEEKSPEILCATILLYFFEFINQIIETPSWFTHVEGADAIFKAWGPSRIKSSFEQSLFYSHVPAMVAASVIKRYDCFIDSPGWSEVIHQVSAIDPQDRLNIKILTIYAKVANLVNMIRDGQTIGITFSNEITAKVLQVFEELSDLQSDVHTFLTDSEVVKELPSEAESSPLKRCYEFDTPRLAHMLCLYWKTTILMYRALCQLGADSSEDQKIAASAAENICKSVEYTMRFKPLGSFCLPFSLHVAYPLCSDHVQGWILEAIEEQWVQYDCRTRDFVELYRSAFQFT